MEKNTYLYPEYKIVEDVNLYEKDGEIKEVRKEDISKKMKEDDTIESIISFKIGDNIDILSTKINWKILKYLIEHGKMIPDKLLDIISTQSTPTDLTSNEKTDFDISKRYENVYTVVLQILKYLQSLPFAEKIGLDNVVKAMILARQIGLINFVDDKKEINKVAKEILARV